MKIITITLNPAFDIHCKADGFLPYRESVVEITSREAGGKGVNISRALIAFEVDNIAVVVVGRENGGEFCEMLERDGMSVIPILCDGRIRENITLHEKENPETRISFGGFTVNASILDDVRGVIGELDGNTVVTFTGSIPSGIETKAVLNMLRDFKTQGAKVVIDSRSVSFDELVDFKPWLIKPNKAEMESYLGKSIETVENAASVADEMLSRGIENAMISLGGEGAVLATDSGVFYANAPAVDAISTIGAGDSAIAGFIDGFASGYPKDMCLARAVSFGTAACMREGTKPPIRKDVECIESKVEVLKIQTP